MKQRSFLLLQGVASPFFSELEKSLCNTGAKALKVNFCGGDLLSGRFFSTALKHINFRRKIKHLPDFYNKVYDEHNITDIILFGDTRPVHIPAIALANERNIHIHVYEEGYLRPNWITLERGGVNAHSSLPKDPSWYLKNKGNITKTSESTGGGLAIRAWHDIRYHLAKTLLKPMFPHFKSHRPDHFIREYWGFIRRIPSVKLYYNKHAKKQIAHLLSSKKPFYLLPLQLNADSQIRLHSSVDSVSHVIQSTIESFSKYASKDAVLLIKNHPLDPWFIDYPDVIKKAAKVNHLDESRILYLEAGDLQIMLENARGTILVNSTVGTSSLAEGCPVIALGSAIYNFAGLTFQGSLKDFWHQATPPDPALFEAFRSCIIEQTQINGSFYNQKGIEMAVTGSLPIFQVKTIANSTSIPSSIPRTSVRPKTSIQAKTSLKTNKPAKQPAQQGATNTTGLISD